MSDELAKLMPTAAQLWAAGIDTSPEVAERYRAMLMQRTGEERLNL